MYYLAANSHMHAQSLEQVHYVALILYVLIISFSSEHHPIFVFLHSNNACFLDDYKSEC